MPPELWFPRAPLVDGYVVPAQFTAFVEHSEWPSDVELEVDCRDGEPLILSVRHLPKKQVVQHPEHRTLTWRPAKLTAVVHVNLDELLRDVLALAAIPADTPLGEEEEVFGTVRDRVYPLLRQRRRERETLDDVAKFATEFIRLRESNKDLPTDNAILEYMAKRAPLYRSKSTLRTLLKRARKQTLLR